MKNQTFLKIYFLLSFCICLPTTFYGQTITGELKKYHKTTLTFDAQSRSEEPITYLNRRMNVTFTSPSSQSFVVPAYFAADGDAAETSATSGNKWRCHITANETGVWTYSVSFRTGTNIAVNTNPNAGTTASIDGTTGTFTITESDKIGDDFRAKGKLQYVGETFARFDNGDYFFEVGADSPETFLEYGDFDATTPRHNYSEVAENYVTGDPSWQNGKGTEIIGAVNYLVNQGMNVHYFLTMNITGDGKRAYPFPSTTEFTTYDVSKLDQWQIVFDHMYNKGMIQEFVFTENENNNWFEQQEGISVSEFSNARKLYYREMIARFGYLNIVYNIGEEANWPNSTDFYTAEQVEEAAVYIQEVSPYSDLISIHNGPANSFTLFPDLAGLPGTSALTAISLQWSHNNRSQIHNNMLSLNSLATADGTKWVSRFTEPFSSNTPDLEVWTDSSLWNSILAGSAGIHYYAPAGGDITNDDYRDFESFYERMKIAQDFFKDNSIPFWNLENNDAAISGDSNYLRTDESEYYIGFLSNGGTATIAFEGSANYDVKWYDPRNGGALQDGNLTSVVANNGAAIAIGNPPSNANSSWVLLITNSGCGQTTEFVNGAWNNGAPNAAMNAILKDNYTTNAIDPATSAPYGNIEACSLSIDPAVILTIASEDFIDITNNIMNDGIITIEHQGSIIQRDTNAQAVNSGVINVHITTPNLDARDFMILGSPMDNETREGVFVNAFSLFAHATNNFIPNPDVAMAFPNAVNFADDNGDNWSQHSGQLSPANGYLVRPQPDLETGGIFDMVYTQGTLNSGIISVPLLFNANKNSSPNMLSNPYASAIFADDFITLNPQIDEIYFWEHLTPPSTDLPGYSTANFSMENISMYNLMGGVAAAGDTSPGADTMPNGIIATAQGFGIKASAAGTATFNNAMRSLTGNTTLRTPQEINKIWLNIVNSEWGIKGSALIGFSENTTEMLDPGYDSKHLATFLGLYSHLQDGSEELAIQSLGSFDNQINVPLGFTSQLAQDNATYSISIADIEGEAIENATVYIKDNITGEVTNLSKGDYFFTSSLGTFNNRFTLQFSEEGTLNIAAISEDNFIVFPNPAENVITIKSTSNSSISQVVIYDLQGRQLISKKFNSQTGVINMNIETLSHSSYFMRINTSQGSFTKHIIKR